MIVKAFPIWRAVICRKLHLKLLKLGLGDVTRPVSCSIF